ncbi:camk camkl protein kinase [Plasmopara halstedii]|uniref:Camk camkl protein kinase n=1 Tax=Plasmopara halstedii TaxID=4781 RepID=A0A0P1AXH3_PLAHL|nr:camk camkl protein kinase [Plasmopara halstedii]CEG46482.1 camk camkl protein kinase [Plasmopara halstedii]|eukprot:XP_024582851.1 camk camkl protein kinase [Plasmopara halstedii]
MTDFDDMDTFSDHAVQGKPIKAFRNGHFDTPKVLFVQQHWSWDEFLCAASQRLEMIPMASRVFNADGAEIDDIMCIEENDMLFFSTGRSFKTPSSRGDDSKSSSDDKVANIVGGYKVTILLGRGGFGEVRLGVHQLTNDKVALKFILKSEMGSLGDVERTTTEIQCLTALNHPSIIKLLRVINEPNHIVLVFELLEGGDLFHYIKQFPGGLSEEDSVGIFSQIIGGVGYAHNQHICHRDLKLENILLANKNDISTAKIADFGLSDFYKPGAMMKTSCGSISYLAPEVFRGTSNAGPPLDVWSLGVILFAIVCGRLPFEGPDLQGTNRPRENVIRNRIMRCQYKLDTELSPTLSDLVTRMLKPDPSERATIPDIFSHPWMRGTGSASSCLVTTFASATLHDILDDEKIEDEKFAITLAAAPSIVTAKVNEEDKLPLIAQRYPRTDSTGTTLGEATTPVLNGGTVTGVGGNFASTWGRVRAGRILNNPLRNKGTIVAEKLSPRHYGSGSSGTMNTPMPIASSPTFKRYATSTGNTRLRPRHQVSYPSSITNSNTSDKTHAERAPAALGDFDRLPVAHPKHSKRRYDNHDDVADNAMVHHGSKASQGVVASHLLETIGRRQHPYPESSTTSD